MNGRAILSVPNDKCIVLTKSCQITIVMREGELFHANLHSLKDCNRLLSGIVPEYDRSIRKLLEYSA